MLPATLAQIDMHWAARLGCSASDLLRPGVRVAVRPGPTWHGVFLLRRAATVIVSVPNGREAGTWQEWSQLNPTEAFGTAAVHRVLGAAVGQCIGPAWLGYVDRSCFRPLAAPGVRGLDGRDAHLLQALRQASGETAWEHSAIEIAAPSVMGLTRGNDLVAAGILAPVSDDIVTVGILTHPQYRGRGYGRTVVSALTSTALERGQIVQYRTLLANTPSLAIAHKLGYEEYAESLAIQLP